MDIRILDQHTILGIDFDGTLVGHPRSNILQQYIVDHPEKTFHLISFRSHNMVQRLEGDLRESTDETGVPLTLAHFKEIRCIPDKLYERKALLDDGREYWGWKAIQCQNLGCTILVDDMYEIVGIFCTELGIPCLNPDLHEGYVSDEATFNSLSASAQDLLRWLGEEDYSQYGECHGPALDELVAAGLTQIHKPGDYQGAFIAKGTSLMYRAVSLTEAGLRCINA